MQVARAEIEFDAYVVQAVDQTLRYCLGDMSAQIVFSYLAERKCPIEQIPKNPELFSEELRNIVGFGRRQILCPGDILEEAVLEVICMKVGVKFEQEIPWNFASALSKLKKQYETKIKEW